MPRNSRIMITQLNLSNLRTRKQLIKRFVKIIMLYYVIAAKMVLRSGCVFIKWLIIVQKIEILCGFLKKYSIDYLLIVVVSIKTPSMVKQVNLRWC